MKMDVFESKNTRPFRVSFKSSKECVGALLDWRGGGVVALTPNEQNALSDAPRACDEVRMHPAS